MARLQNQLRYFYHNLKLTQFYKKITITDINGHKTFGEWQQTDRQTATVNYEMSIVWKTKPRTINRETSCLLVGPEQVTWLKACKLYDGDDKSVAFGCETVLTFRHRASSA